MADTFDDDLPTSRLRGNELRYAVAAGIVIVVSAVVLLVDRHGKGAPAHPNILWQAIAIVAGVALIASVRLRNRLASASLALVGGFCLGQVRSPNTLAGVKTAGFFLPAVFAILVYLRQTRADRAKRQADRGAGRPAGGGRSGGPTGAASSTVTARTRPTGRYTPPKDRTPPPPKGRRR